MSEKKQFIYMLKLTPELLKPENWTTTENEIFNNHFNNLKRLLNEGKLILAGKTDGIDVDTFGIVIIEVDDENEAVEIMNNDPAVSSKIMNARLFPYKIALMKGNN